MNTSGTISSGLIDVQAAGTLDVSDYSTFAYGSMAQTLKKTVLGNGTILGSVSVAGVAGLETTVAPGQASYSVTVNPPAITTNRAGKLNVGNLAFGDNSVLAIDIFGLARGVDGGYDVLNVSGNLDLSGVLDSLVVSSTYAFVGGESFDIMDWGSQSGTFNTVTLPALAGGLSWDTSNLYTTGTINVVVPEPATWVMLMLAAMGLGMYWRRSR